MCARRIFLPCPLLSTAVSFVLISRKDVDSELEITLALAGVMRLTSSGGVGEEILQL
jgi:hypothetical protein